MKRITFLAFLAANVTNFNATAKEPKTTTQPDTVNISSLNDKRNTNGLVENFGPTRYGKENLSSVEIYGPAVFEGTTITEQAQIFGPLNAEEAKFKILTIHGPCRLKATHLHSAVINGPVNAHKVTVEGKITINGPLMARDSHFKGLISIASRKITFESSNTASIEVRKEHKQDYKKPQIIILKKNSIISGDIHFAQGNGKVFVTRGSKVKGQVKGGQIIEK